jgi:hypothetical protein
MVEQLGTANVEKALLIPHTHVVQPTFEGEISDGVQMV